MSAMKSRIHNHKRFLRDIGTKLRSLGRLLHVLAGSSDFRSSLRMEPEHPAKGRERRGPPEDDVGKLESRGWGGTTHKASR